MLRVAYISRTQATVAALSEDRTAAFMTMDRLPSLVIVCVEIALRAATADGEPSLAVTVLW